MWSNRGTNTMTSCTPPPTTTGDTRPAGESLDYNSATDGEADVPVVFYATNTPHNPIAAAGVKARKNSWLFYQSLLPDLDDDVDLTLTSLAKDLGLSYSILSGIIRAHFRMQELPLVERVKLFVCGARFIGICRSGRERPRPFG